MAQCADADAESGAVLAADTVAGSGSGHDEFVEGWLVAQVLGEGTYGEVRLLVHARTGATVALKSVRGGEGDAEGEGGGGGGGGEGAREAALHRALRHRHVVRCLGARAHRGTQYLFLEYARGGELFDRIEPDRGMSAGAARRYARQLLAGLRYLHARGVAHRDIKPENLLLDERDDIKISDFGMATMFRHGARERLLSRVCGTVPYAAPEVLHAARRPYRAPPADLWAAGVVLLAMLAGELPWERAHEGDARYAAWCAWCARCGGEGRVSPPASGPWRKLCAGALDLLRRVLRPRAADRPALDEVARDPWLCGGTTSAHTARTARTARVAPHVTGADMCAERGWCSQPTAAPGAGASYVSYAPHAPYAPDHLTPAAMDALLSCSQPALADELLLSGREAEGAGGCSAGAGGGGGGGAVLQRLVRRMTRVWVRGDEAAALGALVAVLEDKRYAWRRLHPCILVIDCGPDVRMRACALRAVPAAHAPPHAHTAHTAHTAQDAATSRVLLDFRRSRGCGLQFKRRYLELRAALQPVCAGPPPPPATSTNTTSTSTSTTSTSTPAHEDMDLLAAPLTPAPAPALAPNSPPSSSRAHRSAHDMDVS